MKKKLAMRIASLALCVVFVGMLFGAPKAEAVAVETAAVAIGVAVLGSYVAATQLRFTGDVAETISNGITSLVSDWVESSAVAASADDWLANLGNTTQMTSPGMLMLQGIWARECAEFVDWLTDTFGLDEDGKEAVAMPGIAGFLSYNEVVLPPLPDWSIEEFPFLFIMPYSSYPDGYMLQVASSNVVLKNDIVCLFVDRPVKYQNYQIIDGAWTFKNSNTLDANNASLVSIPIWSNVDIVKNGGEVYLATSDPIPVGDVSGQLDIVREDGFVNPAVDSADDDNLTIITGLTSPTLSDLALEVPAQIAAGEFAPTVELTQAGEGTDDPAVPDDATVVPGVTPWLESIFNVIKGIADRIVNGVKGLFVPDQTAVDSLSEEVDRKLPIIPTLQGFGDDLVYKLQHPESCADGLGLTTVVDLGKGRGSYLGDTKHELLDVSWYLEYKPMVDDIIVGFCWLCFLWNCYGALPRIIHGEGNVVTVDAIEFPSVGAGSGVKELGKKK